MEGNNPNDISTSSSSSEQGSVMIGIVPKPFQWPSDSVPPHLAPTPPATGMMPPPLIISDSPEEGHEYIAKITRKTNKHARKTHNRGNPPIINVDLARVSPVVFTPPPEEEAENSHPTLQNALLQLAAGNDDTPPVLTPHLPNSPRQQQPEFSFLQLLNEMRNNAKNSGNGPKPLDPAILDNAGLLPVSIGSMMHTSLIPHYTTAGQNPLMAQTNIGTTAPSLPSLSSYPLLVQGNHGVVPTILPPSSAAHVPVITSTNGTLGFSQPAEVGMENRSGLVNLANFSSTSINAMQLLQGQLQGQLQPQNPQMAHAQQGAVVHAQVIDQGTCQRQKKNSRKDGYGPGPLRPAPYPPQQYRQIAPKEANAFSIMRTPKGLQPNAQMPPHPHHPHFAEPLLSPEVNFPAVSQEQLQAMHLEELRMREAARKKEQQKAAARQEKMVAARQQELAAARYREQQMAAARQHEQQMAAARQQEQQLAAARAHEQQMAARSQEQARQKELLAAQQQVQAALPLLQQFPQLAMNPLLSQLPFGFSFLSSQIQQLISQQPQPQIMSVQTHPTPTNLQQQFGLYQQQQSTLQHAQQMGLQLPQPMTPQQAQQMNQQHLQPQQPKSSSNSMEEIARLLGISSAPPLPPQLNGKQQSVQQLSMANQKSQPHQPTRNMTGHDLVPDALTQQQLALLYKPNQPQMQQNGPQQHKFQPPSQQQKQQWQMPPDQMKIYHEQLCSFVRETKACQQQARYSLQQHRAQMQMPSSSRIVNRAPVAPPVRVRDPVLAYQQEQQAILDLEVIQRDILECLDKCKEKRIQEENEAKRIQQEYEEKKKAAFLQEAPTSPSSSTSGRPSVDAKVPDVHANRPIPAHSQVQATTMENEDPSVHASLLLSIRQTLLAQKENNNAYAPSTSKASGPSKTIKKTKKQTKKNGKK